MAIDIEPFKNKNCEVILKKKRPNNTTYTIKISDILHEYGYLKYKVDSPQLTQKCKDKNIQDLSYFRKGEIKSITLIDAQK